MGKTLMYKEADGYGWTKSSVYSAKEVNEIQDSTNTKKGGRKQPKVSVPSPFARFELVQKAFSNVAAFGEDSDIRDRILVSHALDVMQLWFEGGKGLNVVQWSKKGAIQELKSSRIRGHKLFGKALELYMRQENYGFDEGKYVTPDGVKINDVVIYILTYQGDPIGCTSPTSFFMATSSASDFQKLSVEGDIPLFGRRRMLYQREEAFIEYVYRHTNYMRYGGVDSPLADFKQYLDKQKQIIRSQNEELYSRINQMDYSFEDMSGEYALSDIQVLGYPIFQRKLENQQSQIVNESDFIISSSKSSLKPMILSNNGAYNNWAYISKSKPYNSQIHKIDYSTTMRDSKRTLLPGADVEYEEGWLCENDFLSNVMVMLPYPLDKMHFFDGNVVKAGKYNYLLPIKAKYFDFFDIDTIYDPLGRKDKCGTDPIFKIEEEKVKDEIKSVSVTLLVPVRNGKTIKLKKTYKFEPDTNAGLMSFVDDKTSAVGKLVECPIALNIFPFFRLPKNNFYDIQVLRAGYGWDAFAVNLTAARTCKSPVQDGSSVSEQEILKWADSWERSKNSCNYSLRESFDYLRIQITDGTRTNEAVLIPKWGEEYQGSTKFRFSFDFGTTNSYIAVKNLSKSGDEFLDLKVGKSIVSTLDQKHKSDKMYAEDMTIINQLDVPSRQEFLPSEIGSIYAFPLRTVVLRNSTLNLSLQTPKALLHVNIPFVYGKEDYGQVNVPVPNIKWTNDDEGQKLSKAFIEELVLLARAYALENGGDLAHCSMVWTYPLSMHKNDVADFEEKWKGLYRLYFNNSEDSAEKNITKISESVAPLLYYRFTGETYYDMTLSIDIGGGTCDVVVQSSEEKIELCSFRFAADVIFGAGHANTNSMIQTHYQHFMKLLASISSDESRKLGDMLKKICESDMPSTEANSFLFALESHPALTEITNLEDKSYNSRLKKDRLRKIIFIYFYGAIIYYLTNMLVDKGYKRPNRILFSGTGSKLLNIIGNDGILKEITTEFIERFSQGKYSYVKPINIKVEREQPKQLTAKGALCDSADEVCETFASPRLVEKSIIHDQLILDGDSPMNIYNEDLKDDSVCEAVIKKVQEFNKQFISCISEMEFSEEFGCDESGLDKFVQAIEDCEDLRARMDKQISDNYKDQIKSRGGKTFEDVMFFYPIKDLIQRDIIPNIK